MNIQEAAIELTNHDDRLKVVEQGVSNFRAFQLRMEKQISFQNGMLKAAGVMFVVFMAIFAWALNGLIPAAKIVLDDYYRNHPAAVYHRSYSNEPVVSATNKYTLSDGSDR